MLCSLQPLPPKSASPFLQLLVQVASRMAQKAIKRAPSADREEADDDNQRESGPENPCDPEPVPLLNSEGELPPTQKSVASSSSSTDMHAAEVLSELLSQPDSHINMEIAKLKLERDALKKNKRKIGREIRNQERKRQRLSARARLLSSNDLLEVFAMRRREQKKTAEQQAEAEE